MCRQRLVPIIRSLGALLLTLAIVPEAPAIPGDLDPSFGDGGMVFTSFGYGPDAGRAVAVQADGKLIVAGNADDVLTGVHNGVLLVRYNLDDSLDPTFGIGGKVVTDVPGYIRQTVSAVKVQADGKIVVGGFGDSGSNRHFLVLRYNANGTLDNTFSGDGIATVDFGLQYNECWGLAIQANGTILAAGLTHTTTSSFALARLTTNGSFDTSFDSDGKVTTPSGSSSRTGIALQSDGKIIVAGSSNNSRFCLARYNTNGSLDTSFDTDGILTTAITGSTTSAALAVAIQPPVSGQPERIVAAGWGTVGFTRLAVARYNLNGALDTTFSGDGMLMHTIGSASNEGNAILVQGEQITVAGSSRNGLETFALLARFTLDGFLDGSFAFDYTTFWNAVPLGNAGYALALQAGKMVVVGHGVSNYVNHDFMILKLLANGALDASYDGDGIRFQDVTDVPATLRGAARRADGKIVVVGDLTTVADIALEPQVMWAVARLNEDGSLDPSFGSDGKFVRLSGGPAAAVAIQPDGRIVVAGTFVNHLSIGRLTSDGEWDPEFNFGELLEVPIGSGNSQALAVTLQADGKIVAVGTVTTAGNIDMALVRCNTDGALDPSFSGDGIVTATVGTGDDWAYDVEIQSDGKIIVCGAAELGTGIDVALMRFLANGSIDNSFGSFGRVGTDLGGTIDAALSMVIQPDGKVAVAGLTNAAGVDMAVVRYNANGTLDTSFDADGKVVTPVGLSDDYGKCIARQSDGKLVVAGYSIIGADFDCVLARYETNGALDAGYGFGGKTVVSFDPAQDTPYSLMLDPQGRAIVAGASTAQFAVARVEGDGAVTAVGDLPTATAASRILHVTPNPSGGRQNFAIHVASEQPIKTLSVYGVDGRLVWRRDLGDLAPGPHEIAWDGRTDSGDAAAGGIYFARLDGVRAAPVIRLVRVR